MNAKIITDLSDRRQLRKFMRRVDAAAKAFPFYVLDDQRRVVRADFAAYLAFKSGDEARWRVGWTEIGDKAVSTVFLCVDLNHARVIPGNEGAPTMCFETAVLGPGPTDIVDRYSTWEEAAAGHEAVVRRLTDAA